jgi:hypothetical protein
MEDDIRRGRHRDPRQELRVPDDMADATGTPPASAKFARNRAWKMPPRLHAFACGLFPTKKNKPLKT